MDALRLWLKCRLVIGCGHVSELLSVSMNIIFFQYKINALTAVWLLPQQSAYGEWPRSGEITLVESRGNQDYVDSSNNQIGCQRIGSSLHFGPAWNQDAYREAEFTRNRAEGCDDAFHKYEIEWVADHIKFSVDGQETGTVWANNGFWSRGHFHGYNIWQHGSHMAPFDKEVWRYIHVKY